MAGRAEQGETATCNILELGDDMPEDSLMFGFVIRRQFRAFNQSVDKAVDQGRPDVDFVDVELGRRFRVFRVDTAATMQYQRDTRFVGDVA